MPTVAARTAITTRAPRIPRLLLVSLRRVSLSMSLRSLAVALALVLVAGTAGAQELTIDLGDQGSLAARSIQLILLVTVLSLVPGLAIMVTCFPFIVTVLSILRQGLGLQQSPPNMLIVSLALFLTYFVMEPVFSEAWRVGVQPLIDGSIDTVQAFRLASEPFHAFMLDRVDAETYASLADLRPQPPALGEEAPLSVLVPSFLLSEISRAFQIGFLIFLPFLIIDLVVAAVLMSMGMMMVPPAIVSLPFKLAFFVVADGWTLISSALVRSYF
jgi:flagellar biosynthetic protein FliP